MNAKSNLMPIGRFAASCRLSVKALRHYAEQGLLTPAFVDPNTGYRYYSREQARTAVLIGMLRSLDMPLPSIRKLFSSDEKGIAEVLDKEEQQLTAELMQKHQALASIRRLKNEKSLWPYDVAIRIEPEHHLLKKTITTRTESILVDSSEAVEKLIAQITKAGYTVADPVMCVNETPDQNGNFQVHACVGAVDSANDFPNVENMTLPGGPVAWCMHRGAYEELGLAYHTVFAWMQEHGHEPSGPMREIYRNDPANTPADDLLTEVLVPIRD